MALGTSLNIDRGGNAALVTLFGRGATDRAGHPLRAELQSSAESLAKDIGGHALVGGQATIFQDFAARWRRIHRLNHVVTGAAVVMVTVFTAFSLSPLVNLSQMGVGLAFAVLIDATVIRLILLPAAVQLVGDACWHTPRWMGRRATHVRPTPGVLATLEPQRGQ